MRTKYVIKIFMLLGCCLIMFLTACDDKDKVEPIDDLFRPVANVDPEVTDNTIKYSWYGINNAVSYTLQLSRDNFATDPVLSVDLEGTKYIAKKLKYGTKYQARVRANAADPANTSKWYVLKEATTAVRVVPNVLEEILPKDLTNTEVTLRWDNSYNATRAVIVGTEDGSEFTKTVNFSDADKANGYVTITGLSESAYYRATLYDDSVEDPDAQNFNSEAFLTCATIPSGAIQLSASDDLATVLADAPAGSVYVLPEGMTYKFETGVTIKGSLSLYAAYGDRPVLTTTGQWSVQGTVGEVRLEGIDFVSEGSATYLFNSSAAFTLGKFVLSNCTFDNFGRAIFRVQGANGTQTMSQAVMKNCVVKNGCADYYVFHITNNNTFSDIAIKNSTFVNLSRGLLRGENSTAVTTMSVENCTFYDVMNGDYMIRMDKSAAGVTVKKSIFSKSKAAMSMVRTLGSVSVDQCYGVADFQQKSDNYSITLNNIATSATADDLFVKPSEGNLHFKDYNVEVLRVGDPRWLP